MSIYPPYRLKLVKYQFLQIKVHISELCVKHLINRPDNFFSFFKHLAFSRLIRIHPSIKTVASLHNLRSWPASICRRTGRFFIRDQHDQLTMITDHKLWIIKQGKMGKNFHYFYLIWGAPIQVKNAGESDTAKRKGVGKIAKFADFFFPANYCQNKCDFKSLGKGEKFNLKFLRLTERGLSVDEAGREGREYSQSPRRSSTATILDHRRALDDWRLRRSGSGASCGGRPLKTRFFLCKFFIWLAFFSHLTPTYKFSAPNQNCYLVVRL